MILQVLVMFWVHATDGEKYDFSLALPLTKKDSVNFDILKKVWHTYASICNFLALQYGTTKITELNHDFLKYT